MTTSKAIDRLVNILTSVNSGDLALLKFHTEESDNGNGSLMRILPLIYEIKNKDINEQFDIVWKNSALTHRHIRAPMSCLIYLKFAEHLMNGLDKFAAYQETRKEIKTFWIDMKFSSLEQVNFNRIIQNDITSFDKDSILSG